MQAISGPQFLLSIQISSSATIPRKPKFLCPCFMCNSERERSRKTIMKHSKIHAAHLASLRASGACQDTIVSVENCQKALIALLDALKKDGGKLPMGGECRYPDP